MVGAGEGYCAPVLDLGPETFGEEAVGFREGVSDDVQEVFGDGGC